jgi:nucleoside-diphosphate-sugar epimerase
MVLALLQRGEDPRRIRIIDIRPPTRYELTIGEAKKIQFVAADITNSASVKAAFHAPWADDIPLSTAITVLHTAANLRFYERHLSLLSNSARVNVNGTQNVLDAARSVGATALVYTSSVSVAVRSSRFLLWPWEPEPRNFVQPISDDDNLIPKRHEDFFSNYAVTKTEAERRVRAADKTASGGGFLRTGCIRPSNIFGYNDTSCSKITAFLQFMC